MKSSLIGHSGFIGSNLVRQTSFSHLYRSTNISEIEGESFDLLVCSGVTAVKWWANQNAEEDRTRIDNLLGHLASVKAERVILISTVDVYPVTEGVDEDFDCHSVPNHAYGVNRLYFEDQMLKLFPQTRIVRIGGVFAPGLKKNLIYDLMHDNGTEKINLDSAFQFYNVERLWSDICRMEERDLSLVNFLTEPVTMREVVDQAFPGVQAGSQPVGRAFYDVRTKHSDAMGGANGYLSSKQEVLSEITAFVAAERSRAEP